MQKPLYPLKNMRITQGYGTGTHIDSFAIDDGGFDSGIENIFAPFTGVIKKIYKDDANEVWLESLDKVEYPDGTIDYMTIMFAHCNDVSNLRINQIISQGTAFYSEGTKGNASGNHCHIECGRGMFTGTGWYKNNSGFWNINNSKKPQECFWVDDTINIINDNNYNFKKISAKNNVIIESLDDDISNEETEIETNEEENKSEKIENLSTEEKILQPKLIFTCEKDDIYAIKLKKNQKLFLK